MKKKEDFLDKYIRASKRDKKIYRRESNARLFVIALYFILMFIASLYSLYTLINQK
jgi:hypothetical protein